MTTAREEVVITYTNYRGETDERRIIPFPFTLRFDDSPWHGGPQWLMDAKDLAKAQVRTFAMKDIHSWKPADA